MAGVTAHILCSLLAVATFLKECTASSSSNYVMLEGDCPGPSVLFIRNSVQVSLTSNPLRYHADMRKRCTLKFKAQGPGYFLLLHWDAVRLSSPLTRVFVKNGQTIPTPGRPGSERKDYRSFYSTLTLYYYGHPHYDYLRVTVTAIKLALTCEANEFMCPRGPNSFCITTELLCNGENNCGDANVSDENYVGCMEMDVTTTRPTDTPIPVGLVGALAAQPVIIIFLIVAFCIINRRRQRSKQEARLGANLHRATAPRNRPQNEYVTLPGNTSGVQQKPPPPPTIQSIGVHTSPPIVPPPPEPGPQRMLPPTPTEPDANYMNLQGEQQLPLLFQVPDTNSVPLLHTIGLRKAALQQTSPRAEPEVSISEPGYMEINDADVSQPTDPKDSGSSRRKS